MARGDSHSSRSEDLPQPRQGALERPLAGLGFLLTTVEGLSPLAMFGAPLRGYSRRAIRSSTDVARDGCNSITAPQHGNCYEITDGALKKRYPPCPT